MQTLYTIAKIKKIKQRNIKPMKYPYTRTSKKTPRVFPNHPISHVSNQQMIEKILRR